MFDGIEDFGMSLGLAEEIAQEETEALSAEHEINDTARELHEIINDNSNMGTVLGLAEEIAEEEHFARLEAMSDEEREFPTLKATVSSLKAVEKNGDKIRPFEAYVNSLINGDEIELPF